MSNETSPGLDVNRLPLKSLGLRTGMALQTRRLAEGASKKESQFFGAIEGRGVMVGPLGSEGEQTGLEEGDVCVVRGFTGQYEFSFLSKVLQTFHKPFVYALLAYPTEVDAKRVRQSLRTKASWPTTVLQYPSASTPPTPLVADLVDISPAGAMVSTPSALGAVGEAIRIRLDVTFEDAPLSLELQAKICHSNCPAGQDKFYIGMAFQGVGREDKLVLHYLTQGQPH